jgi:hypothetical protein
MKHLQYLFPLLALALLAPLCAVAENSTSAGGFTIHYNAFTTSTLTPEVAKAYGIKRSKHRAMLNVSLIKEEKGTPGRSVSGRVEVKTRILTGQSVPLPMREIKEQNAVYYIGELPVQNGEKVVFGIEATPEGTTETFVINMEQQFFIE